MESEKIENEINISDFSERFPYIKCWSEGVKNEAGGYSINPGWVYKPVDAVVSEEVKIFLDEVDKSIDKSFDIRYYKAVANWMIGPMREYLNKNGLTWAQSNEIFPKDKMQDLINYVEFTDLIDFSIAKTKIFPLLINNFSDETVWEMMERLNIFDRADAGELEKMIDDVLAKYPDKVADYRAGKTGLLSMFMGDVMKVGRGKVKPQEVTELLKKKLEAQ